MRNFQPSDSYEISLPDEVVEEYDSGVSCYWIPGDSLLLQLSSTLRIKGAQVSAAERLQELFQKNPAEWITVDFCPNNFQGDCTAAQMQDGKGVAWLHIYLTTETLAIYATISGSPPEMKTDTWAVRALKGIRLRPPTVN